MGPLMALCTQSDGAASELIIARGVVMLCIQRGRHVRRFEFATVMYTRDLVAEKWGWEPGLTFFFIKTLTREGGPLARRQDIMKSSEHFKYRKALFAPPSSAFA